MDAFVSAVLLGIFHLFPVPVSRLPANLEYVPAHSATIRSETTVYRMAGNGEMERILTRTFLDTSRAEQRERALYHLDSAGNVTAWEEYGTDSVPVVRGTTVYAEGKLQSASYEDTSGRIFRSEAYTWSDGDLRSMEIVFTDAETTSTAFEYDQGRIVRYRSPTDGPGSYTAIAYPSPDTIRGEEYRDSLLAFATELVFAEGKLAKVRYPGGVATYSYGGNSAIRPRAAIRARPIPEGPGFDALGRRQNVDRVGHAAPFFIRSPRPE